MPTSPHDPRLPAMPRHPVIARRPAIPRSPLVRRLRLTSTQTLVAPALLVLTLVALPPAARPAAAQAIPFVGDPVQLGLIQRAPSLAGWTGVFAGSLLASDRGATWAPVWFPYELGAPVARPSTTRATLFGGGRSLAGGRFRHADRLANGSFLDVSGHYLRGADWHFADPVEERLRENGALLPARDDQLERWGATIRYDPRPDHSDGWAFEADFDRLRGNQLTEVGAAHAGSWFRWRGRADYGRGNLLAVAHVRGRGARQARFYRTARDIEDRSLLLSGELSHSASLGDRHHLGYGLNLRNTRLATGETLTGVYEDADHMLFAEARVGSSSQLSERLSVATAVRVGSHSRVQGLTLSGRATLNVQPAVGHDFEARAERELVLPFSDNLHLDVAAGRMTAGALVYDILARGVPESGFTFNDRCAGGFHDLCMRSPLAPGQKLPADPAVLWNALVEIAAATDPLALGPLRPFFRDPEPGELRPRLLLFNEREWAAGRPPFLGEEVLGRAVELRPVDPLRPMIAHTLALRYEIGVGTVAGSADRDGAGARIAARNTVRGRIFAEVWHATIDNFIGPLRVETPTVFFEPASTRAFIERRVEPLVRLGILPPQLRDFVVHDLTNLVLQIPVGTVMPDQVATPGLLLTYRNHGRVDVSGVNLSASVQLSPALGVRGDFRYVTEECFDFLQDVATDCSSLEDISLNTPKTRGSLAVRYGGPDAGFSAQGAREAPARLPRHRRRVRGRRGGIHGARRPSASSAAGSVPRQRRAHRHQHPRRPAPGVRRRAGDRTAGRGQRHLRLPLSPRAW